MILVSKGLVALIDQEEALRRGRRGDAARRSAPSARDDDDEEGIDPPSTGNGLEKAPASWWTPRMLRGRLPATRRIARIGTLSEFSPSLSELSLEHYLQRGRRREKGGG